MHSPYVGVKAGWRRDSRGVVHVAFCKARKHPCRMMPKGMTPRDSQFAARVRPRPFGDRHIEQGSLPLVLAQGGEQKSREPFPAGDSVCTLQDCTV